MARKATSSMSEAVMPMQGQMGEQAHTPAPKTTKKGNTAPKKPATKKSAKKGGRK